MLNAEEILNYLEQHPQFFEDHMEAISRLTIPHPYSGRTISLTERQLVSLRESNNKLEKRLGELMGYGMTNDVTSDKLHRLAVALVTADNYAKVRSLIISYLLDDFAVQHPALRLWGPGFAQKDNDALLVSDILKANVIRMQNPFCGPVERGDPSLYGDEYSDKIHSQALIPLRATKGSDAFGVLALGSEEEKRFEDDMETLYLVRLGELASGAILRTLNQ